MVASHGSDRAGIAEVTDVDRVLALEAKNEPGNCKDSCGSESTGCESYFSKVTTRQSASLQPPPPFQCSEGLSIQYAKKKRKLALYDVLFDICIMIADTKSQIITFCVILL